MSNLEKAANEVDLSLKPIPLVRFTIQKSRMLLNTGFGEEIDDCYVYVWLVRGSTKNILIDAGVEVSIMRSIGYTCEEVGSISEGLKQEGLSPEDIDIIIITHLHQDHMAMCKDFPTARLIVQKRELDSALDLTAPPSVKRGYPQEVIRPLFEANRFEVIDGDKEIEPGIQVMLTPGHTLGSQSVMIQAGERKVVLTGFCCVDENFYPKDPNVDMIAGGIYVNIFDAWESQKRIKEMADIVVACHDRKFLEMKSIP
jgi:N-acyl homoserine lactone hydrolase